MSFRREFADLVVRLTRDRLNESVPKPTVCFLSPEQEIVWLPRHKCKTMPESETCLMRIKLTYTLPTMDLHLGGGNGDQSHR